MNTKHLILVLLTICLAACGADEAITERASEELFDQALGEGTMATIEAGGTALMQTVEPNLDEAETPEAPSTDTDDMVETTTDDTQNDAFTGGDAGNANDPATIEAGSGYSGLLTGFQAGGDMFDTYRVQTAPHSIIRVTVTNPADNADAITMQVTNSEGAGDNIGFLEPDNSATLVFASANEVTYDIVFNFVGADALAYTFDVVVEPENDAQLGMDAPATPAEAVPIELNTTYFGTSVGWDIGGQDPDCYRVTLPADGSITIDFSAPADQPYESFTNAVLYDANGELIWSDTAEYAGNMTINYGVEEYETATAGDYNICFTTYEFYSYGEYEFMITIN